MAARRDTRDWETHEVTTQDLIITDKRSRSVRFHLVPASTLARDPKFSHVVSIGGAAVTISDDDLRQLLELIKETRDL